MSSWARLYLSQDSNTRDKELVGTAGVGWGLRQGDGRLGSEHDEAWYFSN